MDKTNTYAKDEKTVGEIVGRISYFSGDPFKGQRVINDEGQPLFDESGNQKIRFGFGLLVDKNAFGETYHGSPSEFYGLMQSEAFKLFSSGTPDNFAWKIKDCDKTVSKKGEPYSSWEGHAGHMLINFSTQIPPVYCLTDGTGKYVQVNEGFKPGDYVRVKSIIAAHTGNSKIAHSKPGLYLNPLVIERIAVGKPFPKAQIDLDAAFNTQARLPQGAIIEQGVPHNAGAPSFAPQQVPVPQAPPQQWGAVNQPPMAPAPVMPGPPIPIPAPQVPPGHPATPPAATALQMPPVAAPQGPQIPHQGPQISPVPNVGPAAPNRDVLPPQFNPPPQINPNERLPF